MKKQRGRPSKYKTEFCEQLIAHMGQGLSFESFAALIDVNLDTLYEWEHRHTDFSEAKKVARQKQRLAFEKIGMNATLGKIPGFNATAFVWLSKNMLGWRDRQEVTHAGSIAWPTLQPGEKIENDPFAE